MPPGGPPPYAPPSGLERIDEQPLVSGRRCRHRQEEHDAARRGCAREDDLRSAGPSRPGRLWRHVRRALPGLRRPDPRREQRRGRDEGAHGAQGRTAARAGSRHREPLRERHPGPGGRATVLPRLLRIEPSGPRGVRRGPRRSGRGVPGVRGCAARRRDGGDARHLRAGRAGPRWVCGRRRGSRKGLAAGCDARAGARRCAIGRAAHERILAGQPPPRT